MCFYVFFFTFFVCICGGVLGPVKNRHIYNEKHRKKLKKDIRSQFVLEHLDIMLSPNQHLVHVWQMPWVYLFQASLVACWNLSWLPSKPFCSSIPFLANQYMGVSKNRYPIMEIPIKMGWFGGKPTIFGNIHMVIAVCFVPKTTVPYV